MESSKNLFENHHGNGFFTVDEIVQFNILSVPFDKVSTKLKQYIYVSDITYAPDNRLIKINGYFVIGGTESYKLTEIDDEFKASPVVITKITSVILGEDSLTERPIPYLPSSEYKLITKLSLTEPLYSFAELIRVCDALDLGMPELPNIDARSKKIHDGIYFPISTRKLRAALEAQEIYWVPYLDSGQPPQQKMVIFDIDKALGKTSSAPSRTANELALAIMPDGFKYK
ncbi:hypothetical protein [Pseudidiomarina taiwanensis]|uniref:Uncharacterized protein n=1 Tax=Pseudidiomarina taiwanensis TaxID=337250 RepID=A0A432ZMJ8_9GAMM|nr:hypothetical protein [Pseudidiomarina taiwanensis]RUO79098.1 hypothetical protein CWI83_00845 [Pseudidiomarina taiwanensis]